MNINFIQATGSPTGTLKTYQLTISGGSGLKFIDHSGIATKNTYLSYLGLQSGKYPYVLDPGNVFNGTLQEKELYFNETIATSGIFWTAIPGDGLYYWCE